MVFSATPEQISRLNPQDFVQLLRELVYAEALKAGAGLGRVSVPLQITVPDGGEDGRYSQCWQGENKTTDYIPNPFTIFQSKTSGLAAAAWKKEAWTKASAKRGATRVMNSALVKVFAETGAYVGFTSQPLTGEKIEEREEAIREGIRDTGADPSQIEVRVYDANNIAKWVELHPAVALRLAEVLDGQNYGGFYSVSSWLAKPEPNQTTYVHDEDARFTMIAEGGVASQSRGNSSSLSFNDASARIAEFLGPFNKSVRILGLAGLGKSRFVLEFFKHAQTVEALALRSAAVFCDFRQVGEKLFDVADRLTQSNAPTLLVVDECPYEAAVRLHDHVSRPDCRLRAITINLDDRPILAENMLCMKLQPGTEGLITAILKEKMPQAKPADIEFIREFCDGFPKIAVILAQSYNQTASVLTSVDDVVERILKGAGIRERENIRALEALSLFDGMPADLDNDYLFESAAHHFGDMSPNRMFEHISFAQKHEIVDRRGNNFNVHLRPVAAYLARARLDSLRVTSLIQFYSSVASDGRHALFRRLGQIGVTKTSEAFARKLLDDDDYLGGFSALETHEAAQSIALLTEIVPDYVANHLDYLISKKPLAEINLLNPSWHPIVRALAKLMFRERSFSQAANVTMRLAAAENQPEGIATKAFGQIFQVVLAGTEVGPDLRFAVLNNGIASGIPEFVPVAIRALEVTLGSSHIGRSGGAEKLGNLPALTDWRPKTYGEMWAYHVRGLTLLVKLWKANIDRRQMIEEAIARNLRDLMIPDIFHEVSAQLMLIGSVKGSWPDAVKTLGMWLYFDSPKRAKFGNKVRALKASLMPKNLLDEALLYAKFWPADLHPPSAKFSDTGKKDNYDYGSQCGRKVGKSLALSRELAIAAIDRLAGEELHNVGPVMSTLAEHAIAPLDLLSHAVALCEDTVPPSGQAIVFALLFGIDQRHDNLKDQAFLIIEASRHAEAWELQKLASVKMDSTVLTRAIESIRAGKIAPRSSGFLSYGQRLNIFSEAELTPLIDALIETKSSDGYWAALEISMMYRLGVKSPSAVLLNAVKPLLVDRRLLEAKADGRMDGHLFETLVSAIVKEGLADDVFVAGVTQQIVHLCQLDWSIFHSLDNAARVTLHSLISCKAEPVWLIISTFWEVGTSIERYMLNNLISADAGNFDHDPAAKGVLSGLPHPLMEEWAREGNAERIGLLVISYPIFVKGAGASLQMSPEIQRLAADFGSNPTFQSALTQRVLEMTGGRPSEHVPSIVEALKTWDTHPTLSPWARRLQVGIEEDWRRYG